MVNFLCQFGWAVYPCICSNNIWMVLWWCFWMKLMFKWWLWVKQIVHTKCGWALSTQLKALTEQRLIFPKQERILSADGLWTWTVTLALPWVLTLLAYPADYRVARYMDTPPPPRILFLWRTLTNKMKMTQRLGPSVGSLPRPLHMAWLPPTWLPPPVDFFPRDFMAKCEMWKCEKNTSINFPK